MPHPIHDDIPPLTDLDVEVLYTIVANAQNGPNPSFRALFASYDAVLHEQGIDPDHDQVYFRFLLRMGEGRGEGESLFDRFEAILGEMGIQIEVDRDGDGVEEITRNLDELRLYEDGNSIFESWPTNRLRRRVSFDTVYDTIVDNTENPDGQNAPTPRTRLRKSKAHITRPSSRATDIESHRRPAQRHHAELPFRPGRQRNRAESAGFLSSQRRAGSVTSQDSIRISRGESINGRTGLHPTTSSARGDELPSTGRRHAAAVSDMVAQFENIFRLSDTQMLSDAELFQDHRVAIAARKQLRRWRDKAYHLRDHRLQMCSTAENYDRAALLRQAIGQWRVTLQTKRQLAETEKFFAHLERRADRARDLFLLTKAFTHWAQSSSDEVVRTSVARRHILRTKYFNAWRDITVVNELKVRRQGLRKFLAVWRYRTAECASNEIRALAFHHDRLTERVFWRWFWICCEKRAPIWAAGRIKRGWFSRWADIARQMQERDAWVERMRLHQLQRRCLTAWSSKSRQLQDSVRIAQNFRRRSMLSSAFKAYQQQARIAPVADHAFAQVGGKLVRKALDVWVTRTRMTRQASEFEIKHIKRNAWTTWNDRLRCHALSARIGDRLLVTSLYKWVLVSRCALLVRIRQANLKRHLLSRWRYQSLNQRLRLIDAERRFSWAQRVRDQHNALSCWRLSADNHLRNEALAASVDRARCLQRALQVWFNRHAHMQELHRKASDATFYLACTHSIARWRTATQVAKHDRQRLRRRDAYAAVRRRVRISLLRGVLNKWRFLATHLVGIDRQAAQMYDDTLMVRSARIFDLWRQRADHASSLARYAADVVRDRTIRERWDRWRERFELQRELLDEAAIFKMGNLETSVSSLLKKLNWQLFQIQRQQETAVALRERNKEKHIRIMLRYWAEQALQARDGKAQTQRSRMDQRGSPSRGRTFRSSTGRFGGGGTAADDFSQVEEGTALESEFPLDLSLFPGADDPASHRASGTAAPGILTSTPLPGYLRTPSKRGPRARSRHRLLDEAAGPISTPATAPAGMAYGGVDFAAITPFQRKLSALGYSERRVGRSGAGSDLAGPTPRKGFGAGRFGAGQGSAATRFAGFEDIPEDDGSREAGKP